MRRAKIIPAILAKNFVDFKRQVRLYEKDYRIVQLDIVNKKFVQASSFVDYHKIQTLKTPLKYELHLMVKDVAKQLKIWLKSKKVSRVIFHLEAQSLKETFQLLEKLKNAKMPVGIALKPQTPVERLRPLIGKIHYVLLLAVKPGKTGQKFNPIVYKKIRQVRELDPKIMIGVDGGVNEKNVRKLVLAGANVLNLASYFLQAKNIKQAKQKLSI